MQVWSLGQEDPLEGEMATHSSILAGTIPWTEEPGGNDEKDNEINERMEKTHVISLSSLTWLFPITTLVPSPSTWRLSFSLFFLGCLSPSLPSIFLYSIVHIMLVTFWENLHQNHLVCMLKIQTSGPHSEPIKNLLSLGIWISADVSTCCLVPLKFKNSCSLVL